MFEYLRTLIYSGALSSVADADAKEQGNEVGAADETPPNTAQTSEIQPGKASNLGWAEMDESHSRRNRRRTRRARSRSTGVSKPPANLW